MLHSSIREAIVKWQFLLKLKEIPWNVQKDIRVHTYVLIKRTEEELSLLREEMENVMLYCIQRKECILHQLDSIKNTEFFFP